MKFSTLKSGRNQFISPSGDTYFQRLAKSLYLGVILMLVTATTVFADSGIFQTYAIINKGAGNQFYAGGFNADGAALVFNNSNLGSYCPAGTLILNGGEVKTFKNGLSNVTGANIYYRIYSTSSSPGNFIQIPLFFNSDLGGGDQKWQTSAHNVNMLAGLTAGTYFIEVYWEANTSDGTKFDTNFGANFKATFTVSPPALSAVVTNTNCFGGNNGAINLSVACTPTAAPITQTYTQNFNTLLSTPLLTNLTWTDNVTIPNWFTNKNTYRASNGSDGAGSIYSFGNTAADRALGSIASGTTGTILGAVKITNTTGQTVTTVNVSYTGEQWRIGASSTSVANRLDFTYAINATDEAAGTYLDVNSLDFVGPYFSTGTTATQIDGNAGANKVLINSTFPVSLAPGASIWLRWQDADEAGTDQGLAIDDLTATLTAPATGVSYLWSNGATTEDISGLTAGNYTVTASGSTGTASATYTVNQPDEIVVTATNTPILCKGGSSTVTIGASGGTGALSGTGTHTQAAGTQSYTVTDANGCTKSISVTITEPALLVPSATQTPIACNGGTSTVTISATGGTAPYSGTGIFTQSAGTANYTVTDANNCSKTVTVTVAQPAALAANETHTNVLCNGGSTGTATISASGGTAPYTGTGTFTGLAAGMHTFIVSDNNGCTTSVSVTISEPPILAVSETHTNVNCNGGNNGAIDLSVSGGTPGETINVSENFDGLSSTGTPSWTNAGTIPNWFASVNGSAPTSYIAGTGTGTAGALYSFGIAGTNAIADRALGSVASGSTNNILGALRITNTTSQTLTSISVNYTGEQWRNGNNTTPQKLVFDYQVNATGINSGIWTPNSTLDFSSLINTTTAGPLDGNANANRTSKSATFAVSVPAGQTIWLRWTDVNDGGNDHGLAIDDLNATLTSGGGVPYTYLWTNAATTEDISSLTAGEYTVTVTDANNCTASKTVTITQPTALSASASGANVLCFGGTTTVTVSATGGTAPYTGTGTFTVAAGTHTYTVTDNNGCSTTTSVTIGQPTAALSASASGADVLCFGGTTTVTVSATGGTAPYTGTGTFTVAAGTHTYTVTDNNGCSTTTSVTIGQPTAALSASASGANVLCFGGTTTVTVSANGGTAPYTGTGTFTVAAGTHTYAVTDANGCTKAASITITQPTALVASETHTAVLCNGGTSTVTISATGGTAPYTGTGIFTQSAGTQSYTVTDANGCSKAVSVTVTQPTALVATCSINNPVLYFGYAGDQTAIVSVAVSGGVGPYKVVATMNRPLNCNVITTAGDELWVPGAGTVSGSNLNTVCPSSGPGLIPSSTGNVTSVYGVSVTLMADAIITFTITDANGCITTCTKEIKASDVRCFAGSSTNAKITICHQTGSTKNPCVKICVDQSALDEHLAHGDFVGACTSNCVAPQGIVNGTPSIQTPALATLLEAKASPNPSPSFFNLVISGKNSLPVTIIVRDVLGRVVQRNEKVAATANMKLGQQWAGGTYFIEVMQGNERVQLKVIKAN